MPAISRTGTGLVLTAPDGWSPVDAEGVALALVEPDVPGRFRANVTLTTSDVSQDFTLQDALLLVRTRLAEMRELREIHEGRLELCGATAAGLEVAFVDARAGTLVQTIRLVVRARGGGAELVELVGTCGGDRVDEALPILRDVVDSVCPDEELIT